VSYVLQIIPRQVDWVFSALCGKIRIADVAVLWLVRGT
jgi:hypothetical protein